MEDDIGGHAVYKQIFEVSGKQPTLGILQTILLQRHNPGSSMSNICGKFVIKFQTQSIKVIGI